MPEDGIAETIPSDAPPESATEALPPVSREAALSEQELAHLPALLESLLFIAPSSTPVARLAQSLALSVEEVEAALTRLSADYVEGGRGLRLLRKGDRIQLTSAPEAAPHIERFLGLDLSSKLSNAAMETLAVIAYRQPLTRGDIEAIRGVNCDGVLRTLIARELVEPVGRLEQPGRPYLYGTTVQFLQYFGLDNLMRLPPLPEPEFSPEPPASPNLSSER